jgi:hypothetical protein
LEAYLSKSVPLYWGDDKLGVLNPKAIINLNDFDSIELFVEYVSELYKDKDKMLKVINEPLITRDIDYDAIVKHFAKQLNLSGPK